MAKALEGVRVLDFTQYLSGPHGTSVLSELGAEIIKIERPGTGEPERQAPPKTPKRQPSSQSTSMPFTTAGTSALAVRGGSGPA